MQLVGVGVPVRNGAAMLRDALDTIVAQTYPALDVVLSDNASTDATADICQEYARRDRRFRYVRHERALSALENFRFAFEEARGPFFMWAAHDDLRSDDYVATLVRGAEAHPEASVVFGDVRIFSDRATRAAVAELSRGELEPSFTRGEGLMGRHAAICRSHMLGFCTQIYGLIRREALAGYKWAAPRIGPDVPMLHYLASRGELRHVPGATFYCYRQEQQTSEAATYFRDQPFWGYDRMVADTARAVADGLDLGHGSVARARAEAQAFLAVGWTMHGGAHGWAKHYADRVYERLPRAAKERWRALKRRAARSA